MDRWSLLACHGEVSDRLDLLSLLSQSAAVTTADHAQVTDEASFDSFLFPHLHSNTNSCRVITHRPTR